MLSQNDDDELINIQDEDGLFTLKKTDKLKLVVSELDIFKITRDDIITFRICREGDILLNVDVSGNVKKATLYNFDSTGGNKIVFQTIEGVGLIEPFPLSGIPLVQMKKYIYLDIEGEVSCINATFAILNEKDKQTLSNYVYHRENVNGVCVKDCCGNTFRVMGVSTKGTSKNFMQIEISPTSHCCS